MARKTYKLSHRWIVSIGLAVQFPLLIAAIVAVAVNKAMIEQGDMSATLPEGSTGVVIAYEFFWSIPLIITIGEVIYFISYRHYPPGAYLLSNIAKYIFAVAGLVLCVTRARHGIAIIVVVGLIIVLFLPSVTYGSIQYYKSRNQNSSRSNSHTLYNKGYGGIHTGGVVHEKSGCVEHS